MVLSDLFQRADKGAGELTAAYDRARRAGLACERSYDVFLGSEGAASEVKGCRYRHTDIGLSCSSNADGMASSL
ncbi:DUF2514 domain-containing protein [Pseudomonas khavaziana]|uniref:DUF2514 domain-containing protein n=1 Tax=Pseudomonas khavaziana TaxID=2842351 RepID=UPI0021F33334|nr:DUF2514 domain-containing protein [Pseudomonas khavaziana]